jgi:hypothetical protein
LKGQFEATKGGINEKKNRRRTGNTLSERKMDKRKNNDLQNITQKNKDPAY